LHGIAVNRQPKSIGTLKYMTTDVNVCIAGLGTIGRAVALELDRDGIPGLKLGAVAVGNQRKANDFLLQLKRSVPIAELGDLSDYGDIVLECAPAELLAQIAEPALARGKKLIVLSVGALLSQPHLTQAARDGGGAILVPTGALLGLDAVLAAAEGTIYSVRMITRKPPNGLAGAPFLVENGISIEKLSKPLKIFSGSARDAAKGFPANLNVAVALSLAGVGPDQTFLEIWADPTVTRNTHRIEVDSDSARLTMTIENIPSENPKTGVITARSVVALLRKMSSPLRVGT
jgi:aspartate dehydrogenase